MTSTQFLQIRFKIIYSIIFIGLILAFILHKNNYQGINIDFWFFFSPFIIGSYFWLDKKLLYFKRPLILGILICLFFLLIAIIITEQNFMATIPLASLIGRVLLNKYLDKSRKLDLEKVDEEDDILLGKIKMLVYAAITLPIAALFYWITNLLLDLLIS